MTELEKGQGHLLFDNDSITKSGDDDFKCKAKVVPSPARISALTETIRKGNREAGVGPEEDERLINALITSQTKLHDCEVSCKNKKFYLWLNEQHIVEFELSETGAGGEFLKKVCEGGK